MSRIELPSLWEYLEALPAANIHWDFRCSVCKNAAVAWDFVAIEESGPSQYSAAPPYAIIESSPLCRHQFHKCCLLYTFGIEKWGTIDVWVKSNSCPDCRLELFSIPEGQYRGVTAFMLAWLKHPANIPKVEDVVNLANLHIVEDFGNVIKCKHGERRCTDALHTLTRAVMDMFVKGGVPKERRPSPSFITTYTLTALMRHYGREMLVSPLVWSYFATYRKACYLPLPFHEKDFLAMNGTAQLSFLYDKAFSKADLCFRFVVICDSEGEASHKLESIDGKEVQYAHHLGEDVGYPFRSSLFLTICNDCMFVEEGLPGWLDLIEVARDTCTLRFFSRGEGGRKDTSILLSFRE